MDVSRRRFLRGDVKTPRHQEIRLPWIIDENHFVAGCTRCGDCIRTCPQQILKPGDGGFPKLDFSERECTFCSACTDTCKEPLFDKHKAPWQHVAEVGDNCLTRTGIVCQNCKDACDPRAIRFHFRAGAIARPEIDSASCTGCGACIAPCPNGSMSIVPSINQMSSPS